jgi:hypothetical protein
VLYPQRIEGGPPNTQGQDHQYNPGSVFHEPVKGTANSVLPGGVGYFTQNQGFEGFFASKITK